ncbi:2,3-dimethylmalate dehydratase large subunit [Salinivirga cyanobacteriivorans]|uniref:2,3-dimethylmalate dehydratase large subunit n=1 Tax=Salinivirga cyanobacteriivorans TaxID=1307839 RepID=A0A0S2I4I3_9BACT|nr:aconitate hydratase [Salinivirga cyanobacteriivorans]ALO17369.1 2,3-dimethylmalate dehydratase large subunit [Salinivirga cyanobacteriivorans]
MPQPMNVSQKLIKSHLIDGEMIPGKEIGLKIDQTLTQDATGTLVMLELEAMYLDRVKTEISVQYVDHNLLQTDFKNADDHMFLRSACQRFGIHYSRAGNGVSHPVHMERFGKPGKALVGSDSHTPAAGGLGMLAFGSGGLDVAFVMAGKPLYIKMPRILGVKLTGELPDWVSAKDVVLEMLRRYDVKGCRGMIIEYYGPGLKNLSAMDRHVIANMGTEMGATTTVFPSDEETRKFLKTQHREEDWSELLADEGARYDLNDEIELSKLEPLIACPSSPGNVVKVRDVEGKDIYQSVIGSSANPGFRDFWVVSEIVKGRTSHERVSFDINPTSRQMIQNLADTKAFGKLMQSGARFHQSGCMGCIGMGQAPASGQISLRTMPRNFPGRSGTEDDQVYLCSPETAAASALTGVITDPRDLEKLYDMDYPRFLPQETEIINTDLLDAPPENGSQIPLEKGPNIKSLPAFEAIKDAYELPCLLKMGDNISTDEILKAGAEVLPYRSNIPKISEYAYSVIDKSFYKRAREAEDKFGGHIVVGGENYAQGSSREHAALAPRYLKQVAVLAKSYARIGWQNLVNFGIVPLEFVKSGDYDEIEQDDVLAFDDFSNQIKQGKVIVQNKTKGSKYEMMHSMSKRQVEVVLAGGVIPYFKKKK